MELITELLARSNGDKWDKRKTSVRVVGDASESSLAAYFPDGEMEPIVVPFTEEQIAAVKSREYSQHSKGVGCGSCRGQDHR